MLGLICTAQASDSVSKTTISVATSPSANIPMTPDQDLVDAKLVEKTLRSTQFAFILFDLIKKQIAVHQLTEKQKAELPGRIYWEIMNQYAQMYKKEGLGVKNLTCVITAYESVDGAGLKKIIAPAAYLTEFKETVLKDRKWIVGSGAPTKTQIEDMMSTSHMGQQVLANITTLLTESRITPSREKVQPIFDRIVMMFQSLLLQNGTNEKTFQKFLDQIKKNECVQYFTIHGTQTNKLGLRLITDKIPK